MLYEFSRNVCRMAAQYGSNEKKVFKQNVAGNLECTSNLLGMQVQKCIENMIGQPHDYRVLKCC